MSRGNRMILMVLGIVLVVAGLLVISINTGVLGDLLQRAGSSRVQPSATDPIVPAGTSDLVPTSGLVVALVVGVSVVGLALWWLSAQLPRRHRPSDFRLHQDSRRGSTIVTPAALNQAVQHQVEQLPGVVAATVTVSGAVQAPQLSVRVTVDDRSDVAQVVRRISTDVAGGLALAMGSTVERLGVLVDIDKKKRTAATAAL